MNYSRLGILNEPRFSGSFSVPQRLTQQYIFGYSLGKQIPLQRGALAQNLGQLKFSH
jgi:hypothetical protein